MTRHPPSPRLPPIGPGRPSFRTVSFRETCAGAGPSPARRTDGRGGGKATHHGPCPLPPGKGHGPMGLSAPSPGARRFAGSEPGGEPPTGGLPRRGLNRRPGGGNPVAPERWTSRTGRRPPPAVAGPGRDPPASGPPRPRRARGAARRVGGSRDGCGPSPRPRASPGPARRHRPAVSAWRGPGEARGRWRGPPQPRDAASRRGRHGVGGVHDASSPPGAVGARRPPPYGRTREAPRRGDAGAPGTRPPPALDGRGGSDRRVPSFPPAGPGSRLHGRGASTEVGNGTGRGIKTPEAVTRGLGSADVSPPRAATWAEPSNAHAPRGQGPLGRRGRCPSTDPGTTHPPTDPPEAPPP